MSDDSRIETPMQRRQREATSLRKALGGFRKRKPTDEQVLAAMTGQGELPKWLPELLFLMERATYSTLADLCEMVGTNRKNLMKWRRKHPPLETACKDYLAATFEDEMELPHRQIRPGVINLVAERIIPTFSKDADGRLSEEDVALLVHAILDSMRTRLAASGLPQEEATAILQGVAGDIRHEFSKRQSE